MTNPITNWWRSHQFRAALKSNSVNQSNQLLEEIQQSGARLSLLERVFQDKLRSDRRLDNSEKEVFALRQQTSQASQILEERGQEIEGLHQQLGEVSEQKQELERLLEQTQQEIESLSRDKQQAEQSVAQLHEELRRNRREATLARHQSATHEQHIQDLRQWRSEACEQRRNFEQLVVQKQQEVENLSRSKRQTEQTLTELRREVERHRRQQQIVQELREQLNQNQQEFASTQRQLEEREQQIAKLREQFGRVPSSTLAPHPSLLEFISQTLNFNLRPEAGILQCTGIDEVVFGQLEENLVNYLQPRLRESSLETAYSEIKKIRSGKDPNYSLELMDCAYLMEYFLNNVYCSYIAWFLIYKSNLLKQNLKILDMAAGPGTVLHGLAAFLESLSRESVNKNLSPLEEIHVCYHWLEQQKYFQSISTDLWQRSVVNGHVASNSYWRLDNSDLLNSTDQLPSQFFDFVVICHCFFGIDKIEINLLIFIKEYAKTILKMMGMLFL